jgi:hypothetical protein
MNCFIASAFDQKDVDAIYDRAIRPVLKELKLRPSRVDRVEHNDDIDDRIFRLIDQSEICIADLTFARPSVYYEAGYAFGIGKPVIYIARSDHFRAREDDKVGNMRVHFDLQMKNIIPWTEPNEAFRKRLRDRLRHVLRPLLRSREEERAKSKEHDRFTALSQNERLSGLVARSRTILYSRGFRKGSRSDIGPLRHYPYYAHFWKTMGNVYIQVHLLAVPGINKIFVDGVPWLWHLPMLTRKQDRIVREVRSFCFVAALRASREHNLTALLPSWTPLDRGIYTKEVATSGDDRPQRTTVILIDGIRSQGEFENRFRPAINTMRKGQQARVPDRP